MEFLTLDKIFVLDKFNFVQDKKFFVRADGQGRSFILNDFCKQKMDFLILDKTFVLDNLNFVQDKIFFVRADGRGKSVKSSFHYFSSN